MSKLVINVHYDVFSGLTTPRGGGTKNISRSGISNNPDNNYLCIDDLQVLSGSA
jgi:hypothetical protein